MSSYSIVAFKGRELPLAYEALVFSRWLRSLRFGNPIFSKVDSKEYYDNYHPFITNLLKKPDATVRLAVLSDDMDVALGFSVVREDVLDYVHVQKDHRKHGIAKKLVPEGITTFTHITNTALQIWQGNEKYRHLKFNTFA